MQKKADENAETWKKAVTTLTAQLNENMNKVSDYNKLQKALTETQTKASAAEAQVAALKDILREFKPGVAVAK